MNGLEMNRAERRIVDELEHALRGVVRGHLPIALGNRDTSVRAQIAERWLASDPNDSLEMNPMYLYRNVHDVTRSLEMVDRALRQFMRTELEDKPVRLWILRGEIAARWIDEARVDEVMES
jgi:hypothetical protein